MRAAADLHGSSATVQRAGATVYAAGSLRAALGDAAREFEAAQPGKPLRFTFGAAGLLKDRLLAGEPADVYASANLDHPEMLHRAGRSGPVRRFARNALCALVAPGVDVTSADLVQRMLDPAVKLGTSTPLADPSGDYAWQLFERIEQSGVTGAFDRRRRAVVTPDRSPRRLRAAGQLQGLRAQTLATVRPPQATLADTPWAHGRKGIALSRGEPVACEDALARHAEHEIEARRLEIGIRSSFDCTKSRPRPASMT